MLSFLEKLLVAAAIGGIIGLEREHTKKQTLLGVRTFALVSLFGMLLNELTGGAASISSVVGLVGVFALTLSFYYFRATHYRNAIGITTIVMLPIVYLLGMLVSLSYALEAIAATVLMAYVLVERGTVHRLVEHISRREIIDGLVFGLIAFVLYPLVPGEPFHLWGFTLNLRLLFNTILLVSAISFVSHVVLKFVHRRAVLVASFLGGLVSSLATVMLFSKEKHRNFTAFKLSFTSSTAGSVLRDFVLLGALSPFLVIYALPLFLLPLAAFSVLTWYYSKSVDLRQVQFIFHRPISLKFVVEFAIILFAVNVMVDWVTLLPSSALLYASMFLGGAVNSASVMATVSALYASGKVSLPGAMTSVTLALMGSAVAKLAVILHDQEARHRLQLGSLVAVSVAISALSLLLSKFYFHY